MTDEYPDNLAILKVSETLKAMDMTSGVSVLYWTVIRSTSPPCQTPPLAATRLLREVRQCTTIRLEIYTRQT